MILLDHGRSDELLDRVLSPTIFSTHTNRRIFRGMVYVTDTESWQRIFHVMKEKSRWDLPEEEVGEYMRRAYDFVMDFLVRVDGSEPYTLDPSGERALQLAKRVRRAALRKGGEARVIEEAAEYFGMPETTLGYSRSLATPLYPVTRSARS